MTDMSPLDVEKRRARYSEVMQQVYSATYDVAKLQRLGERDGGGSATATLLLAEQVAKLRAAILLGQKYEVERETLGERT